MHPGRLALLLMLYVSLDFSNPLIPGAVRFVDGGVEAVDGVCARPVDSLADDRLVASPECVDRVLVITQIPRCTVPRLTPPPETWGLARRVPDSTADSASPSEDH